eukprot:TRINITY_DN546_c0_g1_i6.p1 TRINITY_DN546_c0_g1~~TRINITY_DN546_c0_g1_i6.p1  ORF type:complete len:627 (+),score=67.51 TRINITY_DN546_c0_g1_i6:172-2052(+)
MNTLIFLFLQIQLTQVWCATCSGDKPNFLIVITDDQGHDDVGFYNTNGILQTPNIDKFASQSVQFENFYTDSLCAPTRASFLTGRHHLKTGVWGVHGATDYISLDETLISQVLKSNGYSTGMFGKWHNGVTSGYNPWNRGFDVAYVAKLYVFINNPMIRNGVNIETEGWVEDWLADRIIDYLQQRSKDGKPFALVWTPMSIHKGRLYDNENYETFVAPEFYINKYSGLVSYDLARVFGAIEYFDSVFGRVISKLDELKLGDNTIVMLMGDNGPHLYKTDHAYPPNRNIRVPSNLKQEKGFIDENGVLNFLFVRGLNRFPEGKKVQQNIHIIDVMPTVISLAMAKTPGYVKPLDGKDFSPLLCEKLDTWEHSDRKIFFHEALKNSLEVDQILSLNEDRFVDKSQQLLQYQDGGLYGAGFQPYTAVKQNQFKLARYDLYNIQENQQENFDQRITDNTEIQKNLQKAMQNWWSEVLSEFSSFQKPVFLIGSDWQSVVPAIGAIERTEKNIKIRNLFAEGFKYAGDYLICSVHVQKSGLFDASLNYNSAGWGTGQIKISIGQYQQIWDGFAPSVVGSVGSGKSRSLGQIYLEATKKGGRDEMLIYLENYDNQGQDLFGHLYNVAFSTVSQ